MQVRLPTARADVLVARVNVTLLHIHHALQPIIEAASSRPPFGNAPVALRTGGIARLAPTYLGIVGPTVVPDRINLLAVHGDSHRPARVEAVRQAVHAVHLRGGYHKSEQMQAVHNGA